MNNDKTTALKIELSQLELTIESLRGKKTGLIADRARELGLGRLGVRREDLKGRSLPSEREQWYRQRHLELDTQVKEATEKTRSMKLQIVDLEFESQLQKLGPVGELLREKFTKIAHLEARVADLEAKAEPTT